MSQARPAPAARLRMINSLRLGDSRRRLGRPAGSEANRPATLCGPPRSGLTHWQPEETVTVTVADRDLPVTRPGPASRYSG